MMTKHRIRKTGRKFVLEPTPSERYILNKAVKWAMFKSVSGHEIMPLFVCTIFLDKHYVNSYVNHYASLVWTAGVSLNLKFYFW